MTTDQKECILKSEHSDYLDVKLPEGIPVIVGRGPLTRIRAKRCSKQQVKLTADYKQAVVEIVQLGPNPSQVDNSSLRINTSIIVSEGTVLNLLKGEFPYVITFVKESNVNVKGGCDDFKQEINADKKNCEPHCSYQISHTSPKDTANHKRKEEFNSAESSKKCMKLEFDTEENDSDSKGEEEHVKEIEKKLADIQQQIATPSSKILELSAAKMSPKKTTNCISNVSSWVEVKTGKLFLYTREDPSGSSKIAAFDLDHTLITTKTGRVFPVDNHDWRIMLPEIPKKLKNLIEEGYKIVIFTNQRNISKGRNDPADFRTKLKHVTDKLGIPVQAFVSTGIGMYRKPAPGMWDTMVNSYNQGIPVDFTSSFYCGDAAGRIANWKPGKKKDFSSSDRLFAENLQLQFYTPEEFFHGYKKVEFSIPKFDPRNFPDLPLAEIVKSSSHKNCPIFLDENSLISSSPEVIVFVGFPAAGKSYFALNYLIPKGYIHINRDALGSWQKCVAQCKIELDRGHSVVVDNTNPDVESRKRYIEIASKCNVPCRCILFPVSREQARHNNMFRQITANDKTHVGVNDMVLNSYRSKYKEPEIKEGFKDIVKINFRPTFKNKVEERLYRMFLSDK